MLTRSSHFAVAALLVGASHAQLDQLSQAAIKDPAKECTAYTYAPLAAFQSSYPTIWKIADLQHAGVTDSAKNLFATVSAGLPSIAPRGTTDGDWSNVKYSTTDDPDCWWTSTLCTTPKLLSLPPDVTHCEQPAALGYTLDDGPNCSHNAYYDYLNDQKQKATLFYVGSNVMNWPLQAQRGLADGHEICAHSWSHRYMTSLSNEQAFAEIYYSKKIIKDVLGITVQCFRPPFGDTDDRIRSITHALGMRTILWSYDTVDWQVDQSGNAEVDHNYQTLISKATDQQGQINLAHELNTATMNLSQTWLPALQKAYTGGVMPITVCQGNAQPYLETSATFPSYDQWQKGVREATIPAASPATSADDGISWAFSNGGGSGSGGNGIGSASANGGGVGGGIGGGNGSALTGTETPVQGASHDDTSDGSSGSSNGDDFSEINGDGGDRDGGDGNDAFDGNDDGDDDDGDTSVSSNTTMMTGQGDSGSSTTGTMTGTMTNGTSSPNSGISKFGGSSSTVNNSTLTSAAKLVAAATRDIGEGALVMRCVLAVMVALATVIAFYL
ncbi:BZ3500_MvSof-1268-A1-R1_Chr8-1g09748 [Microbotryum saponariae]|uniref:chitin deacetylase n=1 Tax=Microbotryum saponariae TaxID=289078 RepID=A0A2X0MT53_9BASI|nr:BZ3500_MvSof-1268-A1-R1_Chr8-1g09748 [Microbotryum saponariae]SDA08034.1 BZ3501_MvSof-1269-A2-R1_Chr8-1g09471 [Microbotryum saponariae]